MVPPVQSSPVQRAEERRGRKKDLFQKLPTAGATGFVSGTCVHVGVGGQGGGDEKAHMCVFVKWYVDKERGGRYE